MASSGYIPVAPEIQYTQSDGQEYHVLDTRPRTEIHPARFTSGQSHRFSSKNPDSPVSSNFLLDAERSQPGSGTSNCDTHSTRLGSPEPYPTSKPAEIESTSRIAQEKSFSHVRFRVKDWWEEFTVVTLSLVGLLAIVIVLAVYQNKTLSSWQFVFNISFNTWVAILSTLSRTALLVPVASCISQLKWIRLVRSPCALREVQLVRGTR
jgi:hypothetical protein